MSCFASVLLADFLDFCASFISSLKLVFVGSLVYFLCTWVAPLALFNTLILLIKKKKNMYLVI